MRSAAVLVVVLAGCGRLGFALSDASRDGTAPPAVDAVATDPYSAAVLADAPIGYWRLDDASGLVARDEVGNHPGTYDPACTLGVAGALSSGDPAVKFDGSACNVTIGDAFEFAGSPAYTIELWASPDLVDTQVRRLVSRSNGTAAGVGYQLAFFSSTLWFEVFDGSSDDLYIDTSPGPQVGVFIHMTVTVDATAQNLYRDGVLINTTGFTPVVPTDSATVTFGDLGPAPGIFYKYAGVLDEVAIYDHALSAERVAAHYAAR